jgi:hypothetical protein
MIKKNLEIEILFSELDSTGEHQFSFSLFFLSFAVEKGMQMITLWIWLSAGLVM